MKRPNATSMTIPPVAILAGGLATRLGALVADTPKALLDVAGRPFLAWQLDVLAEHGLRDVVLCIGHQAQRIQDENPRYAPAAMRIRYSCDGDPLLGTGGAVKNALPALGSVFFVMYGDSYLRCNYLSIYERFMQARHADSRLAGLMTVYENRDSFDQSNVEFRDGKLLCYSKTLKTSRMHHIDWGLGILTAEAFEPFSNQLKFDLADVYASLVDQGRLMGHEVHERFYEIGSRAGLSELSQLLAGGRVP
jgi:N-acetyl-alpha-D-muramate 1-phosphate uridylyltransferase